MVTDVGDIHHPAVSVKQEKIIGESLFVDSLQPSTVRCLFPRAHRDTSSAPPTAVSATLSPPSLSLLFILRRHGFPQSQKIFELQLVAHDPCRGQGPQYSGHASHCHHRSSATRGENGIVPRIFRQKRAKSPPSSCPGQVRLYPRSRLWQAPHYAAGSLAVDKLVETSVRTQVDHTPLRWVR